MLGDWLPNTMRVPSDFPILGLSLENAISREARSAGLLCFTCLRSGIAASALLSGLNAREDFDGLQRLIDWSVENRHMLPDLKELSFDALRVNERPLIATVVWQERSFWLQSVEVFKEHLAAGFFAWALSKS